MANLNRQIITKKIIDLLIDFLKANVDTNKLYQNTKVTDRFAYESAQIPCVIIRNTTNTQKRIHYDDFMDDQYNRVQLIPISGNDIIQGNNNQRVNLPLTVDWNPTWNWDTSIPLPSGSDISEVVFTSGTAPYNTTDNATGIIITVPPPSTFVPTSIERAEECENVNQYTYQLDPTVVTNGSYNLAIGLTGDQYYLVYSGTGISGINTLAIDNDEYIINPPGLSGVSIKMNDVMMVGDQYLLNTYDEKQFISERFGGMYDININFDVYAMSTIENQELCDAIERFLVEKKKDLWDQYGLTLTSWSKGGDSEQAHMNEYIFKSSLTTVGMVEWHEDREVILISSVVCSGVPIGGYTTNFIPVVDETHIQTGELSGTRTALLDFASASSITRVFDPSGTTYPAINDVTEASGAGYFLSGNAVNWTTGAYPDFASVEPSGWVPASGETYYVDYQINGYVPPGVETFAGTGGYTNWAYSVTYGQIVPIPSGI